MDGFRAARGARSLSARKISNAPASLLGAPDDAAASVQIVPLSPVLARQSDLPVRPARRGGRRTRGPRARGDRLRHRRPARADRPADHRRAQGRRSRAHGLPGGGRTARAARGDRRPGSSGASASRLDPDTQIVPTLGSKEAIFTFAHVVLDPRRAARTRSSCTEPGYPVPERGALLRRRRGSLELPLREENGFLPAPRRRRRRGLGTDRRCVWVNYPEQPDRRDGAARLLRAPRRARARARLRARLGRGLQRALVRRAARARRCSSTTGPASPSSTRCRSARR